MVISSMGLNAKIRYTGGDRGWVGDVPKFAYIWKRFQPWAGEPL